MARFEHDGEFFEVWLEAKGSDLRLFTRSGALGAFAEPTLFPELSSNQLRRRYRELQLAYLGEGWHRVRHPGREAHVDSEPREPALDAALLADPSDGAAALVYSDWLQQRGHPRGALIAVQQARSEHPEDAELRAEELRLRVDHANVFLGPLAGTRARPRVSTEWELGFVRRARIEGDYNGDGEDVLWNVLRHPSLRYLRDLEIGRHQPGDQDNTLMSALIVRADPAPPLRRLVLADIDQTHSDGVDLSRALLGDLSELGARYPRLEDLQLKGRGDVVLGELRVPRARRFALRTSSLTRATLASILDAPWPELEELELWFGSEDYGCDVEPRDVDPLFAPGTFPKLRTLRLMNAMFTDELCARVTAWPQASALETLDVSLGTMSDVGAALLVGARDRFVALKTLNIAECCLTPGGIGGLEAAGFTVDEYPVAPARRGRTPAQKGDRYVSVSE